VRDLLDHFEIWSSTNYKEIQPTIIPDATLSIARQNIRIQSWKGTIFKSIVRLSESNLDFHVNDA
jgi:hypothetical protein